MKINQVIWVINSETKAIVPVQVVEKVIKETADGVNTTYIVATSSGKRGPLSEKDRYFENLSDAKKFLLEAAMKLIEEVVVRAQAAAEKFQIYDDEKPVMQPTIQHDIIESTEDPQLVTLPDGRVAKLGKVKIPENL